MFAHMYACRRNNTQEIDAQFSLRDHINEKNIITKSFNVIQTLQYSQNSQAISVKTV